MSRRGSRRGAAAGRASPNASFAEPAEESEETVIDQDQEYHDASNISNAENITPGMLNEMLANIDAKWNERLQSEMAELQAQLANAKLGSNQKPVGIPKIEEINKFCPYIITSGIDKRVINNDVGFSQVVSKFKPGDSEKITLKDLKTSAVIWKLSKFQSTMLQFDLKFSDWTRPVLNILFSPDLFNHMVTLNGSLLNFDNNSYPKLLEMLFSGYNFRIFSLQAFGELLEYKYAVGDTVNKVIDNIMERANLIRGVSTFPVVLFKVINVLLDSVSDLNIAELQDLTRVEDLQRYLASKNYGLATVKSTDALVRANKPDYPTTTPSPVTPFPLNAITHSYCPSCDCDDCQSKSITDINALQTTQKFFCKTCSCYNCRALRARYLKSRGGDRGDRGAAATNTTTSNYHRASQPPRIHSKNFKANSNLHAVTEVAPPEDEEELEMDFDPNQDADFLNHWENFISLNALLGKSEAPRIEPTTREYPV